MSELKPIVIDTNVPDAKKDTLDLLISSAIASYATDIHIPHSGICYARRGNLLEPFINLDSGEPFEVFDADFTKMLSILKFDRYSSASKRQVWGDKQLRVLYLSVPQQSRGGQEEFLILRAQSLTPPPLESCLPYADVLKSLQSPHGLILVAGMIGAGKTTLAAGICASWASAGKHIFTVEDPIEYEIKSINGRVTQLAASLYTADISFEQAAMLALRADIDGLFIGECRNATTFKVVLDAAITHEPCITTLHAGGFADAITRLVSFAQSFSSTEVACFTISQALHSILHVSLAYTAEGKPVPMVAVLPFWSDDNVRKILSDFNPVNLTDKIRNIMRDNTIKGLVSYDMAAATALAAGATQESIDAAKSYSPEVPSYYQ